MKFDFVVVNSYEKVSTELETPENAAVPRGGSE